MSFMSTRSAFVMSVSYTHLIGRPIRQFLSAPSVQDTLQTGEEHTGDPCQLGNNLLSVTSVPIRVNGDSKGAVVTIQEVHNIQNMEQKLRKAIIASGHFAKNSFTDVIGTSEAMQRVKERAETYARVDSTVLIYGKTGTGKEPVSYTHLDVYKRQTQKTGTRTRRKASIPTSTSSRKTPSTRTISAPTPTRRPRK